MWKKYVLVILVAFLLTSWSVIYLVNGIISVVFLWSIQAFSFVSSFILIGSVLLFVWKGIFRKRIDRTLLFIVLFSIIGAWPLGWFANIGGLAYPADVHSTSPKVVVRFPLNERALIGWGGARLETNYHVIKPNERWAYDILIPPAEVKSSKLDDYGIYGAKVMAPASGTVVSINNDEKDLVPGSDDFQSMAGNHIYLRLDETGTFLVLAHLKKGSIKVKEGQHVNEGEFLAQVGNSGSSSEPHLHIHHQRQDPSKVSMFLSEGLPLYFRTEKGVIMPEKGEYIKRH
ncbi:peptidoglycan DD-metalloendopeptidase family protein [Bacillus cereus group sp. BfR-BA-00331]|uniref:M23 family metallopeptidase n=1 Tax=Bacillus cereus group TaxID=86661 RepID=UPI000772CF25|nr:MULTISPECIES: M23 family metallopeptidase [Bacillus cereus group]ONG69766.1 peptidase M24 [Bacillus cereus]MCC2536419.1 peptidoglycan DD-metalloendopeptidase family protein [Bacillus paranthracis]MDA1615933.1 peptidoglycan DD-metalloendopeptidase family protein [Bacillus cereus group sp. TH204-1LC]MDA2193044.1 peptidoglycan DD-metalloendopeptidase family protein [Bacillus cereus group sp. Bc238]MDA2198975.1 peptidoglycan DD-metalloendopeptidase family protein [Bacillus cereus group sp. Bc23